MQVRVLQSAKLFHCLSPFEKEKCCSIFLKRFFLDVFRFNVMYYLRNTKFLNEKVLAPPLLSHTQRSGEVGHLIWLITKRSLVRIQPPQPKMSTYISWEMTWLSFDSQEGEGSSPSVDYTYFISSLYLSPKRIRNHSIFLRGKIFFYLRKDVRL